MQGYSMQSWMSARGTGPEVVEFIQDAANWLEIAELTDAAFVIQVSELTLPGGASPQPLSLTIETAPTVDSALFRAVAPALVFDGTNVKASATPYLLKSVRTPSTVPLAALLRWRVDVPGASGPWAINFRIQMVAGKSRFFAPTDLTGCRFWGRSDMGITKAVGGGVETWADQSGNGNHATQLDSLRQPSVSYNQINGWPAITFDGTNDVLATAAFSIATYTVLMVTTGQDATNGYFFTRSTPPGESDTLYGTTGSTIYCTRAGSTSAKNLSASWGQYGASTAKLLTVLMDGTHAGHKLRINGSEQSLTTVTGGDPGVVSTSDPFTIAARGDAVLSSKIKVAEVICYDRALAEDELVIVEEYLRRRYGLY